MNGQAQAPGIAQPVDLVAEARRKTPARRRVGWSTATPAKTASERRGQTRRDRLHSGSGGGSSRLRGVTVHGLGLLQGASADDERAPAPTASARAAKPNRWQGRVSAASHRLAPSIDPSPSRSRWTCRTSAPPPARPRPSPRLSSRMNRSIVSMLAGHVRAARQHVHHRRPAVQPGQRHHGRQGHGAGGQRLLTGGFYTTELTGAIVFGILADRYGRKLIMLLGPALRRRRRLHDRPEHPHPGPVRDPAAGGRSTAASVPSTLGFIAAETSHDEKLRGRVVSLFELVSLGGMLAVGPALAGVLWDGIGRQAFFLNCGMYMVAAGPVRLRRGRGPARAPGAGGGPRNAPPARRRGETLLAHRDQSQGPALHPHLAGHQRRPRGVGAAGAAAAPGQHRGRVAVPDAGLRGHQYRLRDGRPGRRLRAGAALLGPGLRPFPPDHPDLDRGGRLRDDLRRRPGDQPLRRHLVGRCWSALVGVAIVAIFFMSGATPAALGLLADVSEGFEEDRSAIMGLYSVFLGLGQVIGADHRRHRRHLEGDRRPGRGHGGLCWSSESLALLNLRAQEGELLEGGRPRRRTLFRRRRPSAIRSHAG